MTTFTLKSYQQTALEVLGNFAKSARSKTSESKKPARSTASNRTRWRKNNCEWCRESHPVDGGQTVRDGIVASKISQNIRKNIRLIEITSFKSMAYEILMVEKNPKAGTIATPTQNPRTE